MKEEQQPQPPRSADDTSVSSSPPAPSASEKELNDLRAQNDRLRSELRLFSARDTLLTELTAQNARSPELLFDASVNRFEFNDDGALTNGASLINDLHQKFPEQFVTEEAVAPPPIPPIHAGAGRDRAQQTLTREALAKMTPQEVALLDWNDVKHVLTH